MGNIIHLIYNKEDKDFVRFFRSEVQVKNKNAIFNCYPSPDKFESKISEKIKQKKANQMKSADIVVCLIGHNTYLNKWIDWEIETAAKFGKPLVGVKVHGSWDDTVPESMEEHGGNIVSVNYDDMYDAVKNAFMQVTTYQYASGGRQARYPKSSGTNYREDLKPDIPSGKIRNR